MSYIGADHARALAGAWQEVVGWQQPGRPSHLHHGPYGSRGARWGQAHHGYPYTYGAHSYSAYPYGGQPYGNYPSYPAYYGGYPQSQWGYVITGAGPAEQVEAFPQQMFPPPMQAVHGGPRLVERPGPTRADRITLPMSSGVPIAPNVSAQITSRPQSVAFRPERIIVGGAPATWIINDIKVGNRSQFAQSGDVPGEMFAATTIDSYVSMETVQTSMDFVMVVTYVGDNAAGAPFVCGVLGTAAI